MSRTGVRAGEGAPALRHVVQERLDLLRHLGPPGHVGALLRAAQVRVRKRYPTEREPDPHP